MVIRTTGGIGRDCDTAWERTLPSEGRRKQPEPRDGWEAWKGLPFKFISWDFTEDSSMKSVCSRQRRTESMRKMGPGLLLISAALA